MVNNVYTVSHIDQHGVTRMLLLTESEYQICLHRAQENPEDLDLPIEQDFSKAIQEDEEDASF